jgi:PIN domain nuclease of toxin-antitoxin system
MNLLLDTVTFVLMTREPRRLSRRTALLCKDPKNTLFLSSVSVAELIIKHTLGKFPLPVPPSVFVRQERVEHGIQSLPFDEASALLLESLPFLHRDPFDRFLVCQAIAHELAILTPDAHMAKYKVKTIW